MPTEIAVTQQDINNIAKKLDEFGAVLSERERSLLLGIFGLAGKELRARISQADGHPAQHGLASGFRDAFQPGIGGKLTLAENETEGGSVGIGIKYSL
jgi:hypothetical protein